MPKDRPKKLLHQNVTDTECRGDARGQDGLPQAAAEVPEEYFSGQRNPSEKCVI